MSAVKWSAKDTKPVPVNADELLIIDSDNVSLDKKNKLVTIGTLPNIQALNTDVSKNQTLKGGTGITIADAAPDHTFSIDNAVVVTLNDIQTLTNKTITDATNNISASVVTTGTLLDSVLTSNIMQLDESQTNTGIKLFQNNTVKFRNDGNTFNYNLVTSVTLADREIKLPDLGSDDVFVFEKDAQTLTNKIINASDNALSNLTIGNQVSGSSLALSDTATIAYLNTSNLYTTGSRQVFGPSDNLAGLNVGSILGNPGTQTNGDIWYASTANKLLAIIDDNVVDLSPAETLLWTLNHSAEKLNLTNTGTIDFSLLGADSLPASTQPYITYDDNVSPKALLLNSPTLSVIRLDINRNEEYSFSDTIFNMKGNSIENILQIQDSNSNELLEFTGIALAANNLVITNATTTNPPILSAKGGDSNIDINLIPKGAGSLLVKGTKITTSVSTQTVFKGTDQTIPGTSTDTTISGLSITLPNITGGKAMMTLLLLIDPTVDASPTFKILDDSSVILQRIISIVTNSLTNNLITFVFEVDLDGSLIEVQANSSIAFDVRGGGTSNVNSSSMVSFEIG